jgi:hypothetical protein
MRWLSHVISLVVAVLLLPSFRNPIAEELSMGTPRLLEEQQGDVAWSWSNGDFVGGVLRSSEYARNEAWPPLVEAEEAQPSLFYVQWGSGGQRTIRCESQSDRYAYCPTYTNGRVRLERQLSNAPCRQYQSWGADGDGSGIWVRNGCRAVFVVGGGGWGGGGWGSGGGGRTIVCKSEGFRYNRCPVYQGRGRVTLSRQLSDASCVRGSSWGVDRDGIWVNNGCAAEFTIR